MTKFRESSMASFAKDRKLIEEKIEEKVKSKYSKSVIENPPRKMTEGLELKPGIQTMIQLRHDESGQFVNFILNRTEKKVTIGRSDKDTGKLERNGNTKEYEDHARRIWSMLVEQGYKRSL